MHKAVVITVLLIILYTACKPAVTPFPSSATPTIPFAVTLTSLPNPSVTPLPLANIVPSNPSQPLDSLSVISADNVSRLDKLFVLTGHTNRVTDLIFSPDGAYLASTGWDQKIRLWDLEARLEIYSLPIHEADLNVIAFSPDGSLLASGEAIWNINRKEIVHTLEQRLVAPGHVAFSPDGSQVVIASYRTIKSWDVATGKVMRAFDIPADTLGLFNIKFSPDGKSLAAGSAGNGTIFFWAAETGQRTATLEHGNKSDVHDIEFSSDGELLASGGTDDAIRLWNVTSGKELRQLFLGTGLYSLAFSPDSTLLATAGPSHRVNLWDVESGRMLRSLPAADELMAVAFSPNGRLIAAGGYDNLIVVWGISQ